MEAKEQGGSFLVSTFGFYKSCAPSTWCLQQLGLPVKFWWPNMIIVCAMIIFKGCGSQMKQWQELFEMLIRRWFKTDWIFCWNQKNHSRAAGTHQALGYFPNPAQDCCLQERYQSLLKKSARVFYFSRVWGGQKSDVHKAFAKSSEVTPAKHSEVQSEKEPSGTDCHSGA